MAKVLGYWKLDKNENFDDYMKAEGVNFALRKVGNSVTSYEEITQDGDNWELKITSTFKNAHLKFRLGEEFDETTMDGRHVKSTITLEGDKLVHVQKTAIGTSRLVREVLEDGSMVLTCHQVEKDVSARRIFKRCEK